MLLLVNHNGGLMIDNVISWKDRQYVFIYTVIRLLLNLLILE